MSYFIIHIIRSLNALKLLLVYILIHLITSVSAQPPCLTNPMAGDFCETATPMCNLNGYCGNTSSSYTAYVSPSNPLDENNTPLGSVFCAGIQNNSWLKFIAESTTAVFDVWVSNCSNNNGIQMQIYATTDCYNYTAVSNCWNPGTPTNGQIIATGLIPGNVYFFMIDGLNGDVCDYVIASNSGVSVAPTISAGQSICPGGAATLTAEHGLSYQWSSNPPDPGLTAQSTQASIHVSPTATTVYTVTVSTAGPNSFCPNSSNVLSATVTVANISGMLSAIQPATCNQSNGSATVTVPGGTGNYQYIWSTVPAQTDSTAINLAPGNYVVTITRDACVTTVDVTIPAVPVPVSTITSLVNTVCSQPNGSATVIVAGGTPAFHYLWNTTPPQTTQQLQQVYAGTYVVTITDSTHCVITDTVTLTDSPGPTAQITNVVNADCEASAGSLTAAGSGGSLPYSYHWNTSPMQTQATATGLYAGNYSVTVTDAHGCEAVTSGQIITNNAPVADAYSGSEHCGKADGFAGVTVTGGSGNYTYLWNTGQSIPEITKLSSGIYTVTIHDGWCALNFSITINMIPGPTASFIASPPEVYAMDDSVSFYNNSAGNPVNWHWDLGDSSFSDNFFVSHKYQEAGIYPVTLWVTDAYNCKDSVTHKVVVKEIFTLYVPNTFTPNGDGVNDEFCPYGLNVDPDHFDMTIYDRWGNLAFSTRSWYDNHSEPWNGRKNNSNTAGTVDDVYVYRISLKEINGIKHMYSGSILLLR